MLMNNIFKTAALTAKDLIKRRQLASQDYMLLNQFPKLHVDDIIPNTFTNKYNCYAHALGRSDAKITRGRAAKRTLRKLGFRRDEAMQPKNTFGVDRIAVYHYPTGQSSHMAKQLSNNQWESKMGDFSLVRHNLEQLEGDVFGNATQTYSRNWLVKKPLFGLELSQNVLNWFPKTLD